MSTAVAKINPNLPASVAKLMATMGEAAFHDLAGGVTSGFPIISYRGKVWRIRKGGEEHDVMNEEDEAVPSLELVLVKSNPLPSKIFYAKSYAEGDSAAPDCWSANGISPDANVTAPVCKTCAACPKNVWGSLITQQGSKAKACSDARRIAVASKQELEEKGADAPLYLLRIPPASLNPLKDYAEKILKPKAIPYFAVITKVGFDPQAAYPKLTFKPKEYLSEEMAEAVIQLRGSEDARRILAESEEFAGAEKSPASQVSDEDSDETPTGPSAPAASKPKKKVSPRPAEEEDVGLDEPAPTPKKKAAPAPVADDEEDEPAPTPKKKAAPAPVADDEEDEPALAPVKTKAKAKAKVESEDEPPPPAPKKKVAAPVPAGDDFDAMLNSILG